MESIDNILDEKKLKALLSIGTLIAALFVIDLILRIYVNYKAIQK